MSALAVRRAVVAVCVAGVIGMIVSSVADSTGGALTFGLVTATAVVCLIVVSAVAPSSPWDALGGTPRVDDVEAHAVELEGMIERLVASGADEDEVRALVRQAVRLAAARRR